MYINESQSFSYPYTQVYVCVSTLFRYNIIIKVNVSKQCAHLPMNNVTFSYLGLVFVLIYNNKNI